MTRRTTLRRHGYAGAALLGCLGVVACSEAGPPLVEPDEVAPARRAVAAPTPTLLASGLEGASGSALGPGGALFVAEGAAGRISRIDPETGAVSTFASGLPPSLIGIGGVMDIAFIGSTAYALVTLVGPDVGGSHVSGIYRLDPPDRHAVVADIGAWSIDRPPETDFFVPSGVHYSLEVFRGGFLVTDGHHNRVLRVTLDGEIAQAMTFGNTVPTGLEVMGNTVYMAEAGPVPHAPEDGRVVSFRPGSTTATIVATGAPLLVDVERGQGRTLYALSQGPWDGAMEGSPAVPNTGALLQVGEGGELRELAGGLDRPTSMEVVGNDALVVTMAGEVWRIAGLSAAPFGRFAP